MRLTDAATVADGVVVVAPVRCRDLVTLGLHMDGAPLVNELFQKRNRRVIVQTDTLSANWRRIQNVPKRSEITFSLSCHFDTYMNARLAKNYGHSFKEL